MKKLSLLPLTSREFEQGLASLTSDTGEMETSDLILELEGDFERWIASGASPAAFPPRVRQLLESAEWPIPCFDLGKKYPEIYRKLEKSSGISSVLVLSLLSHLNLIQSLVCDQQFSAARVCQVIGALDHRLQIDFKTMGVILRAIPALPSLSIASVREVLEADKKCAEKEYGDSGQPELVSSLQDLGHALHLTEEFGTAVQGLFNPEIGQPNIAYLQVLMCVSAVVPFYDHPSEIVYEFSPRGDFGTLVMDQFPKDLVNTKNAMLNNLKSVYRLSEDWARAKRGASNQAFALVTIVGGLSSLSYSARKILAEAIRRIIFRSLEVLTTKRIEIGKLKSRAELESILKSIQDENTGTAGILEQRITDFLATVDLSDGKWRVRGLGDSVNASNTSSKKLGDLDFQDATNLKCVAYEAHGGKLNAAYFNDHILTLEQTLKHRIVEWQKIGDLANWSCHVIFIAHGFSGISEEARVIEGIECRFTLKSFKEGIAEVLAREIATKKLLETLNETVVKSLNRSGCAHSVRERAVKEFRFKAEPVIDVASRR